MISVILNPIKDKVLLIKRRDVPVWVLPGGGVDQGELPEEAIIRECLEETGLQVKIIRQVAEYIPLNRLAKLTYLYECLALKGEISTGNETHEIAYFPINETPPNLFFLHREWLNDALKNESEVIRQTINQVTYWNLLKYFCQHPYLTLRFALTRLGFPLNS